MIQAMIQNTSKRQSSLVTQQPARDQLFIQHGAACGHLAAWARSLGLTLAIGWMLLLAACASPEPPPDLVISAQGCDKLSLTLPSNQLPQIVVKNTASEPMVVSLPNWNNVVTVAPGERGILALEPYAWGDIDFYCLTERNHTLASGGPMPAGLVCGLDPYAIRPRALNSGILRVEKHDRLRAATGG